MVDWLLKFTAQLIHICMRGWKSEIGRLKQRNRNWQMFLFICLLISVILWKPLLVDAFHVGLLFGVSYLWATAVAFGTGLILRTPYMLLCIYVGMILGDAFCGLRDEGIRQLIGGNVLGAIVLVGMSIYLKTFADRIQGGDL
jgi:hypothetical protein